MCSKNSAKDKFSEWNKKVCGYTYKCPTFPRPLKTSQSETLLLFLMWWPVRAVHDMAVNNFNTHSWLTTCSLSQVNELIPNYWLMLFWYIKKTFVFKFFSVWYVTSLFALNVTKSLVNATDSSLLFRFIILDININPTVSRDFFKFLIESTSCSQTICKFSSTAASYGLFPLPESDSDSDSKTLWLHSIIQNFFHYMELCPWDKDLCLKWVQ